MLLGVVTQVTIVMVKMTTCGRPFSSIDKCFCTECVGGLCACWLVVIENG